MSLHWAPVILDFPSLWQYLQTVLAYPSPPVVACFGLGLFWTGGQPGQRLRGPHRGTHCGNPPGGGRGADCGLQHSVSLHPDHPVRGEPPHDRRRELGRPGPDPETIEEYTWNPSHVERELEHMPSLPWYKNFFVQSGGLLAAIAIVFILFW